MVGVGVAVGDTVGETVAWADWEGVGVAVPTRFTQITM